MEYIGCWIRNILYVNLLCFLVNGFMRTTTYENYIRFFTGFFIMLSLMKPVIDFGNQNLFFNRQKIEHILESYIDEMELEMEETLKEVYQKESDHIDIEMEQTESEEGNSKN